LRIAGYLFDIEPGILSSIIHFMIKTLLRWLFDPWVMIGTIVLTGLFFGGFLLLFVGLRASSEHAPYPTAIISVIAAPTFTSPPSTTNPDTAADSTENPFPSPQPGDIRKGALVQVSGTEGDGLRLRAEPGLGSEIKFLAFEAEVFKVEDGPQEKSGYTWWYLVAPYDNSVQGWAVSNFLTIVQEP
jgi:hypothetical protein